MKSMQLCPGDVDDELKYRSVTIPFFFKSAWYSSTGPDDPELQRCPTVLSIGLNPVRVSTLLHDGRDGHLKGEHDKAAVVIVLSAEHIFCTQVNQNAHIGSDVRLLAGHLIIPEVCPQFQIKPFAAPVDILTII